MAGASLGTAMRIVSVVGSRCIRPPSRCLRKGRPQACEPPCESPPGITRSVKLEGIHHITCITGDAPRNVDFYARVMGLRLVKKTVNQDDPTVYHLFYGDEHGDPGLDLTFFEYPGVQQGRNGAGMIHRIVWRVASEATIGFWSDRLGGEGVATRSED